MYAWYVWKEDWPDWKLVSEVEGLTEMIYRVMHVSPPPPPRGASEAVVADIMGESSLKIEKVKGGGDFARFMNVGKKTEATEDTEYPDASSSDTEITTTKSYASRTSGDLIVRNKKRYNKRFLVTIQFDNKVFKSYTRDISVGGINLEEHLPDWLRGQFKLRITKTNSKQAVELMCMVIENQPDTERHRLMILPLQSESDEKNLENWIAA